jgi:hypothetical protein
MKGDTPVEGCQGAHSSKPGQVESERIRRGLHGQEPKIVAIDILADPARLRQLDLVAVLDD